MKIGKLGTGTSSGTKLLFSVQGVLAGTLSMINKTKQGSKLKSLAFTNKVED